MEGRRGQRELCGKRGPSEKYKATWKNRFCLYFKALQFFVCCFRPDIGFFQFFFYLQHGLHNKMAEGGFGQKSGWMRCDGRDLLSCSRLLGLLPASWFQ